MAIYHLSVKPVQRSKGRSATAAAAYRAGEKITDERTGEEHDYRRKSGVIYKEIITPDGSKIEREKLWNMAELAEKRKDATTARDYEIALPFELSEKERITLATDFAGRLARVNGVAVDVCIHAPTRGGDDRNFHAHILTTTRKYAGGELGRKADVELSDRDRKKMGLDTRKEALEGVRAEWACMVNEALDRAKVSDRVTHKSLAAQGIDRAPSVHLGPAATAMERRGIQTERGNLNRAENVQEQQAERKELASLERQQQGIHAARQRFYMEKLARVAAKTRADERKRQEAERKRKRQVERAELERQYGQAICMLVCPQSLSSARSRVEYGQYLDRLQTATPEQRAAMEKELHHAEQRYGAQELFYSWAKIASRDTSISGRERVRDAMLKAWDRATPELRERMERKASEYIRTHERQRSGMSLGM